MARESVVSIVHPEGPFALRSSFPDAQGIFDARYATLEQIKHDAFVVLDANVLLLPYKLENVSLPEVIAKYKILASEKRLVVPGQAAREFAKHRSAKVAEIVKHLRDESSLAGPRLSKKIGALVGDETYDAVKAMASDVAEKISELTKLIKDLADKVAADVGEDPVSIAYREVFSGIVVEDPADCQNETTFMAEMTGRYERRQPPGYKDSGKPHGGAGDLIIWKGILEAGREKKANCIFVTGDEKSDWYVQANGAFQPRLELLEEYRACSGKTLHVIPLSRLLQLVEAPREAVEDVQRAELASQATPSIQYSGDVTSELSDEIWKSEMTYVSDEISLNQAALREVVARLNSARAWAEGLKYHHPGRRPAPGETQAEFEARAKRYYAVEAPAKQAEADRAVEMITEEQMRLLERSRALESRFVQLAHELRS